MPSRFSLLLFATAILPFASTLHAQTIQATPSGVRASSPSFSIEVTALREDVLRVREWRGTQAPEDSSWAVLPASRAAHVSVTATAHGFRTSAIEFLLMTRCA